MARIKSTLELSIDDHISPAARRIDQNLENLRQQHLRNTQAFQDHRNALATTAVAAFALAQAVRVPIQSAIDFESKLEDINQKVGTTKEGLAEIGAAARELGVDTTVGAAQMAEALDGLMAGGLDTETSLAVASPIGKVATAYKADVQEMVSLSTALLTNMDIAAADIEDAFDVMSTGGKLGRFELSDMAGSFEEVTASAQSLRISGKEGLADLTAALQVARMGAGSGSQAVTNLSNYMSKLMAPDAIKKFGEAGVDIVGSVNQAIAEGESPIEHTIGILDRLTEGGKQDLLGKYFADAEVQKFIRPMIQNLELYRSIREEALGADGVVQADFNSRMGTSGGVLAKFEASVEELNLAVGGALLPKLTEFIESVTPMVDGVSKFVTANEELVAAVVQVTAALIGLRMLGAAGGMFGALMGMRRGGKVPGRGAIGGPGGNIGPSTAGAGNALMDIGPAAAIIADMAGTQIFDAINGEGATASSKAVTEGAWDRTAARFMAMWNSSQYDNGLVSAGTQGGPDAERMAALRADIARLEGAQLPVTPPELAFMKAELEELEAKATESGQAAGQNLATGIGSQGPVMNAEMARIMAQLRARVESGIAIPVTLGPNLGAIAPPSAPRIGAQAPTAKGDTIVHVGGVNVAQTNANPQQIGRQVGQQIADRVNASRTNGGMM